MAVEKESSVDFIPETIEEEYALLAGRLKAVEAYLLQIAITSTKTFWLPC